MERNLITGKVYLEVQSGNRMKVLKNTLCIYSLINNTLKTFLGDGRTSPSPMFWNQLAFKSLCNFLISLLKCISSTIKLTCNTFDYLRKGILKNRIHIVVEAINKCALSSTFPVSSNFLNLRMKFSNF